MSELVPYVINRLNLKSDKGATAVEYGLMVALIAVVIIVAVTSIGVNLADVFTDVAGKLTGIA